MSTLLNERSLTRARKLINGRLALVLTSVASFSLGCAAVLIPATEALIARFTQEPALHRVALWVGVFCWLSFIPRLVFACLRSVDWRSLAVLFPRLIPLLELRPPGPVYWYLLAAISALLLAAREHALHQPILPLVVAENPVEWGVFWMATAVVAGALVPVLDYLQNEAAREAFELLGVLRAPQYLPSAPSDSQADSLAGVHRPAASAEPSIEAGSNDDGSLYQLYRLRSAPGTLDGFRVMNVPVYFCVLPSEDGYTIEGTAVQCEDARSRELSKTAADCGLDWAGFARWRLLQEEVRYSWGHQWEDVYALTAASAAGSVIRVSGRRASYSEFLTRDKSADLRIEGVLIRDILERPTWTASFDLANLALSDGFYSYCVGVNVLYCTRDGFLVLQRRATGLQTGGGNLGASVAGSLQWKDIAGGREKLVSFDTAAVLRGVRRETREELGLTDGEVQFDARPCTGLGLNLRHGRDPNLYFWGRLNLTHSEISRRRWHKGGSVSRRPRRSAELGRDAWEWDHLVFLPIGAVARGGSLADRFDQLLGTARHLRAALYAAAQTRGFISLRESFR